MEIKKVTPEELTQAQELQSSFNTMLYNLGNIELGINKIQEDIDVLLDKIEKEKNKRKELLENIKHEEQKIKNLVEELEKKYGSGELNLETGEIK